MQNKVILITGSNGEIGQALIKKFIKDTSNIIITIDLTESVDDFSVHESFCGTILDLLAQYGRYSLTMILIHILSYTTSSIQTRQKDHGGC